MVLPGLDRLRRGRSDSNDNDVEQQRAAVGPQGLQNQGDVEMRETSARPRGRLFPVGRPVWPAMFRGRSDPNTTNTAPRGHDPRDEDDEDGAESPKTPRFTIGLPTLPSTRLHLPHLTRTWTNGSNGPASRPPTARPNTSRGAAVQSPQSQSRFPFFSRSTAASPIPVPGPAVSARAPAHTPTSPVSREGSLRPASTEPNSESQRTEASRAEAPEERRRQRERRWRRGGDASGRQTGPPRKFMFCFPWIKSRRVRAQILRCFVSGMFLTLLLAICKQDPPPPLAGNTPPLSRILTLPDLALSITKNINNSEFTVLLILIILFTTIFFCHALIRLCMLVIRPRQESDRRSHMQQLMVPGGYAIPRQPIRVVLVQDEEVAGVESDTTKQKPPAYGMWRESVVCFER